MTLVLKWLSQSLEGIYKFLLFGSKIVMPSLLYYTAFAS